MTARKPRPRRVRTEVHLDPVAWARVYGLDPANLEAIQEDMSTWAFNLLAQAAEESGVAAGESAKWAHE
jgi:hypothetical protein